MEKEVFELSSYEKLQCIGKGGFGTAYLCKHPRYKTCVMKEAFVGGAADEELSNICKEAGILASLKHPNVIRYMCHAAINTILYIVMEYASGGDLHNLISNRTKAPDEKEVIRMFSQVVCGVSYIHEKDIIHRDICAKNVLICRGGLLKLSDFGMSKRIESVSSGTSNCNLSNCAPELCWGGRATKSSDMWAVGCLLYHIASGTLPFLSESLAATVKLIVSSPTPRLPSFCGKELSQVLQDLLNKRAALRPTASRLLAHPTLALTVHSMLPMQLAPPEKVLESLGFRNFL